MLSELRADAIIDSFNKNMVSMNFIHEEDRKHIEKRLALLSDAEVERTKTMEAAKWLWKLLFERSLKDITNNFRGYHELCGYFDEYANYDGVPPFLVPPTMRDFLPFPLVV